MYTTKLLTMAALIPAAAFLVPGIINAIGGILGIANESRKLSGGRVKLHRKRRGKGLSPMYIARPYAGGGLRKKKKKNVVKRKKGRGLLFPAGRGLSPMYIHRPYVGSGLRQKPVKAYHRKGGAVRGVKYHVPYWGRIHRGKGMLTLPGGHMAPLLKQLAMPSLVGIRVPPRIDPSLWSTKITTGPKEKTGGKGLTKRILRKRLYGRGVVADTLGKIPLLGGILGPIVRALGGRVKKSYKKKGGLLFPAGRGLSPMYIARPYVGAGLRKKKKSSPKRKKGGRYGNLHRMSTTINSILRGGKPAGGALVPRKGYYRKGPSGKRVHVRQTVVRVGAGRVKGGYKAYTWGPNLIKC